MLLAFGVNGIDARNHLLGLIRRTRKPLALMVFFSRVL